MPDTEYCEWKPNLYDDIAWFYDTECKQDYYIDEIVHMSTIEMPNNFKYCPYCGKPIKQKGDDEKYILSSELDTLRTENEQFKKIVVGLDHLMEHPRHSIHYGEWAIALNRFYIQYSDIIKKAINAMDNNTNPQGN